MDIPRDLGLMSTYLLIHRVRRMVHQHRALLIVQFAIHACVTDQVYDPFLAFVLIQA